MVRCRGGTLSLSCPVDPLPRESREPKEGPGSQGEQLLPGRLVQAPLQVQVTPGVPHMERGLGGRQGNVARRAREMGLSSGESIKLNLV